MFRLPRVPGLPLPRIPSSWHRWGTTNLLHCRTNALPPRLLVADKAFVLAARLPHRSGETRTRDSDRRIQRSHRCCDPIVEVCFQRKNEAKIFELASRSTSESVTGAGSKTKPIQLSKQARPPHLAGPSSVVRAVARSSVQSQRGSR